MQGPDAKLRLRNNHVARLDLVVEQVVEQPHVHHGDRRRELAGGHDVDAVRRSIDAVGIVREGISAFLPPIAAIWGGSAVFMVLIDLVTRGTLGYNFFPNWNAGIVLFLMVPLAAIMSVEWNVILSSRVSDVRVAMQLGALVVLPFGGIYVAGELNLVPLGNASNLLIIAGILLVVDVLLLYVARATFRREEILTKWK